MQGSNLRPTDSESVALPAELMAQNKNIHAAAAAGNFEPCRDRTCDPQIKSLLLYQLS